MTARVRQQRGFDRGLEQHRIDLGVHRTGARVREHEGVLSGGQRSWKLKAVDPQIVRVGRHTLRSRSTLPVGALRDTVDTDRDPN